MPPASSFFLFSTTTNHKQVATSEITESKVNGRGGRPKAHYTTEPAPDTARSPTSQANHVPRVAQRARISLRHEPEMSLFSLWGIKRNINADEEMNLIRMSQLHQCKAQG
ncbi:hypothetical protein Ddc_01758 [Ditylenchus destructor]|nr:hypothetical protein Ddc_01758 [Ditylenchus destructor]